MKPRRSSMLSAVTLVFAVSILSSQAQSQSMCSAVSGNRLVMANLCSNDQPGTQHAPAILHAPGKAQPPALKLVLTAQDVSGMVLDDPPAIRPGDILVFEANRADFILQTYLSNGKMIVTQPLTKEDAANTTVQWRKGVTRLDYPETVNHHIVGFKLIPLHQNGEPLLVRAMKIYRNGRVMLELEKSDPWPKPAVPEPPMSYPSDSRVLTARLTEPNLLGREPQSGYLAPSLPAFSFHSMIFQTTGTSTGDPNHFKYAGQELDAESGLYHMGARYYSPSLGRFTSPDPLYIELHRLADPQQLNLYNYGRNNPTTLSDPTGLDIALQCKDNANCTTATNQVNTRKDGQSKVELGKDGKWHPVGNVDASKLNGAEKAFYSALTDTNIHATLTAVSGDGSVFFGTSTGKGANTVDVADTAQLAGAGLSPGSAVAHEALEAYATAADPNYTSDPNASRSAAHRGDPFPGFTLLGGGGRAVVDNGNLTGYQYTLRYNGTGAEYQVNTTLKTPIPVASFTNPQTRAAAQKSISEEIVSVTPK